MKTKAGRRPWRRGQRLERTSAPSPLFVVVVFAFYFVARIHGYSAPETDATSDFASIAPAARVTMGSQARLEGPGLVAVHEALKGIPQSEILLGLFETTARSGTLNFERTHLESLLNELRRDPDAAFAMLSKSLLQLPREQFALARAEVLKLMGTLPSKREAARAVALKEAAESAHAELPVVAQEVFLSTAYDFNDALTGTLSILDHQRDRGTRTQIAELLVYHYPMQKERILTAMAAKGVDLSYLRTDPSETKDEMTP